jgi:phage terminase small subunit
MNTAKHRGGGLTARQERFVAEYLVDLSATTAARRAGYRGSQSTLSAEASRLLRKPAIATAVKNAQAALIARVQIRADAVVRELARIAFSDVGKLVDVDGRLLSLVELPEDTRRAIAALEMPERRGGRETRRVVRVRFFDKLRALEMLGKHLGLFSDRSSNAPKTATIEVVDPYLARTPPAKSLVAGG